MFVDEETKVVYVADTLGPRFPSVFDGLNAILERHGIPLRTISGIRDIWCRDYMPIQVSKDRFVQFRYAPDYLTGKYEHLRADGEIGPALPFIRNCVRSQIVLDGGNVVRWHDTAILTDKIYKENPSIERAELRVRLRSLLSVERLIVIRKEPYDPFGHADGMVRWVDDRTVVVNDYGVVGEAYRASLLQSLRRYGLEPIEIPYYPHASKSGEVSPALGNWVNFLRVGELIVVPTFGGDVDRTVLGMLRVRCPDLVVEGLDCQDLAREGGGLNCVTWQFAQPGER